MQSRGEERKERKQEKKGDSFSLLGIHCQPSNQQLQQHSSSVAQMASLTRAVSLCSDRLATQLFFLSAVGYPYSKT